MSLKLKGSILIYSVYSSLIIASICTFFIVKHYSSKKIVNEYEDYLQSKLALNSVLNKLIYTDLLEEKIGVDEFNSKQIEFSNRKWGVFTQASTKINSKRLKLIDGGLYGTTSSNKIPYALHLASSQSNLSITGNTIVKGNVYLGKPNVKQTYVEGQSYTGKKLVYGSVFSNNNKQIESINKDNITQIKKLQKGIFENDSIYISNNNNEYYFKNSFFNKTLIIKEKDLWLNRLTLDGNIIIYGSNSVTIDSLCTLNNIILIAPKITIKEGVKGSFQAIASDSLLVENGVTLHYPSAIGIVNDTKPTTLIIDSLSSINGTIFNLSSHKNSLTVINKNVTVMGKIIANSKLMFQGNIKGSITANKLFLKTPSTTYYNHLIDATIDATNIPNESSFYSSNTNNNKKLILCLE